LKPIIVGTRGSLLARTQTQWVIDRLRGHHPQATFETKLIVTSGDRFTEGPLSSVGGKGLFTREIEDQLLDGSIDLAVHSMKDLPGDLPPGLTVGAVPVREDPRDAWVSRHGHTLATLPAGSRVGSTSLRRVAQVLSARPDLVTVPLRGNIDTRLRKVREGDVDATLLAAAGLNRAGFRDAITAILEPHEFVPAAGQGALAIEVRADDARLAEVLAPFRDRGAEIETAAERRLIALLGGGCNSPIGAHARSDPLSGLVAMRAVVLSVDGKRRVAAEASGADPLAVAGEVHRKLIGDGAGELLSGEKPAG